MALKIRINNVNKKRIIRQRVIKKAVFFVLKRFRKKDAFIEITFVDNRRIKVLNRKYMKRTLSTDILSFMLEDRILPKKKTIVGDIYISSDAAHSNAKRFKTSFQKEILLYTIHGMLHLLGFEDKTVKEKNKIRKLEHKLLKLIA